ncbi:MAG: hypothetical protein ABI480_16440 [Chitinophagaceae bacterium]
MKKIISLSLLFSLSTTMYAQSGRIRISFAGFDCYRETWDDILNADGKGDEVYFNFGFALADKNGNSKLSYEKRTNVYGDATGNFSNRISAGSFVDLFGNNRGGIKAGDTYRCNDVIGEYDMADGDILTVVPTGWEYDPIADNRNSFTATMGSLYTSINQKLAPIMIGLHVLTGNLGGLVFDAGSLGIAKIKAGGDQGELGKPGTRPIGMEKYGDFSPKLVVLNTPNLSAITSNNFGFGTGIIAVNYDEVAVGNVRDHGNYTILLKIEFIPKAGTAPPPPPTTASNNNSIPPPLPPPSSNANAGKNSTGNFRKASQPNSANSISGNWVGTYGNGESNNTNYYSFRLNADKTMQVIAANGNVIANGNYTYTSNQLTGTYTYTNAGNFSFSATMEANGALNGTWGSGSNVRGGGRWVMSKQ